VLIWIINPYGNLPGEGWSPYRSTFIAEAAVARGHQVTWWVSNFEHRSKRKRSDSWRNIEVHAGYQIRLVPSIAYQSHISFARINYERTYARNLIRKMHEEPDKPDVIIHGEPALCFSDITSKAIKRMGVKLVIDVLDLWPELFAIKLPYALRSAERLLFAPLYARRARFFQTANGFIAASRDYLQLAARAAPNRPGAVVYWGTNIKSFSAAADCEGGYASLGLPIKRPGEIWAIYAGTLGENYDIRSILQCAEALEAERSNVRILIAGDGPLRPLVESTIQGKALTRVHYLGRLDARVLIPIYKHCDVALSSYVSDSTVSMPIKAYDYFAAGLPLINSLGRDLGRFVAEARVGVQYTPEDAEGMRRAIRFLAENPGVRTEMRSNALRLAATFDWEAQYGRAIDLVEAVVAGTPFSSS